MRILLVALMAVTLTPSLATAGGNGGGNGGGTKPTSSIRVLNNGDDTLAVIVNPPSDIEDDLFSGILSSSQFLAAGGRFVGPGSETTIGGLRAGSNSVVAAYVSGTGSNAVVSTADSIDVTLTRNRRTTITADGDVDLGVTLSGP